MDIVEVHLRNTGGREVGHHGDAEEAELLQDDTDHVRGPGKEIVIDVHPIAQRTRIRSQSRRRKASIARRRKIMKIWKSRKRTN
uniref:Uncharacterized protein n=1 Tax=Ciona savignyi TaxID=51511 RepID=H2ZFB6_CIOSA